MLDGLRKRNLLSDVTWTKMYINLLEVSKAFPSQPISECTICKHSIHTQVITSDDHVSQQ